MSEPVERTGKWRKIINELFTPFPVRRCDAEGNILSFGTIQLWSLPHPNAKCEILGCSCQMKRYTGFLSFFIWSGPREDLVRLTIGNVEHHVCPEHAEYLLDQNKDKEFILYVQTFEEEALKRILAACGVQPTVPERV